MAKGIMLGHYIYSNVIKVDPAKIEVIMKISTPRMQKHVRSFLGHARYYKIFIEKFSKIASPLFSLLMKNFDFLSIGKCEKAFLKLKCCVSSTLVLPGPN